jgi:DNA-binding transcriptional MerR regulator
MTAKIYYKIGEVAEMFNVNTSLIRYWESEFKIIKPKKSEKGTRLFTQRDIDNFRIIHELVKVKGMTIQGAKDFIERTEKQDSFEKIDIINTLDRTKKMLQEIRSFLGNKDSQA